MFLMFFMKDYRVHVALIFCLLLFQKDYECTFTYASQGGTNEVSVLTSFFV